MSADSSYVVRGAEIYCTSGSHRTLLDMPVCHGSYIREKPMLHEKDCIVGVNIFPFGACSTTNKACTPALGPKWCDAHEDTLVDGVPALTINCTIICSAGGVICVSDNGQGVG